MSDRHTGTCPVDKTQSQRNKNYPEVYRQGPTRYSDNIPCLFYYLYFLVNIVQVLFIRTFCRKTFSQIPRPKQVKPTVLEPPKDLSKNSSGMSLYLKVYSYMGILRFTSSGVW